MSVLIGGFFHDRVSFTEQGAIAYCIRLLNSESVAQQGCGARVDEFSGDLHTKKRQEYSGDDDTD